MDWLKIAQERKEELLAELTTVIQIESVLDEKKATTDAAIWTRSITGIKLYAKKRSTTRYDCKKY